jgi:hypothetical protein
MVPDDLNISTPNASATSGGLTSLNDDRVAPSHATITRSTSIVSHHTSYASPTASPTLPVRDLNVSGSPSVDPIAEEEREAKNVEHDCGEVATITAIVGTASVKAASTRKKQSSDVSLLVGTPITYKGKEGKIVDSSFTTNLYDVEIAGKVIRGVPLSDVEVSKRKGRVEGKKQ